MTVPKNHGTVARSLGTGPKSLGTVARSLGIGPKNMGPYRKVLVVPGIVVQESQHRRRRNQFVQTQRKKGSWDRVRCPNTEVTKTWDSTKKSMDGNRKSGDSKGKYWDSAEKS